ncbi:MAG: hypothetical protein FWG80_04935 [Alphaproteobacteria bacterium]|nr:hypothetical protein [Alphaproteobacteria bacterium]
MIHETENAPEAPKAPIIEHNMGYKVLSISNDCEKRLIDETIVSNDSGYSDRLVDHVCVANMEDSKYLIYSTGHLSAGTGKKLVEPSSKRAKFVINSARELDGLAEIYQKYLLPDGNEVYKKISDSNYERGKLHGTYVIYDEVGAVIEIGNHDRGKTHGEIKFYDGLGIVKEIKNYNKGILTLNKIDNKVIYYDEHGLEIKIDFLDESGNVKRTKSKEEFIKERMDKIMLERATEKKLVVAEKVKRQAELESEKQESEDIEEKKKQIMSGWEKRRAEFKKTTRYKLNIATIATQIPTFLYGLYDGASDENSDFFIKPVNSIGIKPKHCAGGYGFSIGHAIMSGFNKKIWHKLNITSLLANIPSELCSFYDMVRDGEEYLCVESVDSVGINTEKYVGAPGYSIGYAMTSVCLYPFIRGIKESKPKKQTTGGNKFGSYLKNTECTPTNIVRKTLCMPQYFTGAAIGLLLNAGEKIFVAKYNRTRCK